MRLTLSSDYVLNTTFTNEAGQVMYKTSHPLTVFRKTTIHKIVPNTDPMDMRDKFKIMGEIEWHVLRSTIFRLDGEEMRSKDFLQKKGITGSKRTFKGQDSCLYRWDMLPNEVVLFRDDGCKVEVARYHRDVFHIFRRPKSYLEVNPDVTYMLDLIILTFVYMEKIRMDEEVARNTPSQ